MLCSVYGTGCFSHLFEHNACFLSRSLLTAKSIDLPYKWNTWQCRSVSCLAVYRQLGFTDVIFEDQWHQAGYMLLYMRTFTCAHDLTILISPSGSRGHVLSYSVIIVCFACTSPTRARIVSAIWPYDLPRPALLSQFGLPFWHFGTANATWWELLELTPCNAKLNQSHRF